MTIYNQTAMVHAEVVNDMTTYEKNQLMDELTTLLQNQGARVEVSQERGFPYLWRVLTGKQRRLQDQIIVNQAQINSVFQELFGILNKRQNTAEYDIQALNERVLYQERITALQSMYIIRMNQEIARLGGQAADMEPLEEHLGDMMQKPARPQIQTTARKKTNKLLEDPFFSAGSSDDITERTQDSKALLDSFLTQMNKNAESDLLKTAKSGLLTALLTGAFLAADEMNLLDKKK